MSIRARLVIAASVLLGMTLGTVAVQWRTVEKLKKELVVAVSDSIPVISAIQDLRFGALRVVSSTSEFLLIASHSPEPGHSHGENPAQTELDHIAEGRETFETAVKQYRSLMELRAPASLGEVEQVEVFGHKLLACSQQLIGLSQNVSDPSEVLEGKEELEEYEQALLAHLSTILAANNSKLVMRTDALVATATIARWVYLAALTGSILALMLIGFIVTHSIVRPLDRLGQVARRIGEGDLDARAVGNPANEIGLLASVLNSMAERLGKTTVSRDALNQIIATMSEGLLVTDVKGNIEQVNPAAIALLGVPAAELTGGTIAGVFGVDLARSLRSNLGDAVTLQTQGVVQLTATQRYISDERGDPQGTVIVLHDLRERLAVENTLREATQKAEANARARSQFLANVSHEIRTPLHGVLGMLDLLGSTSLNSDQKEFTRTATSCAQGLLSVVNDVLDFSKADAGKLVLEERSFDLRRCVEDVLTMFANRAQTSGVELCADLDDGVETPLVGDPARLSQILVNLVGNAIKFTQRGQVVVRVAPAGGSAEAAHFRFEVQDSGLGIAAHTCEKLFSEFVQGDASVTRRHGGTGLGLAISKHLASLMGGEIGVISEVGVGSTFWFTAKFARDYVCAKTPLPDSVALAGRRALIVDDNATSREILHRQLLRWRMRSDSAADAEAALAVLREAAARGEAYEVALVGRVMPGMDGLALARAIDADAALANTSLVMLTPIDSPVCSAAGDSGIAAWLIKPVRQTKLLQALMTIFEVQRAIPAPTANAAKIDAQPLDGTHVLLAEDNEVNQKVAEAILQHLGCNVTLASNGEVAVEAAMRKRFDIVLMDCQMPGMDGYAASAEIRMGEARLARERTPIVALTAHAIEGDREKCLASGMDDYMSKPFTSKELAQMLERWIVAPASVIQAQKIEVLDELPIVEHGAIEALSELTGNISESNFLESIANDYVNQATRMATDIPGMLDSGDLAALQSVAHQLKSTSAYLGAQRVTRAAAALEHAARQGHAIPQLRALAEQLTTNLQETSPALLDLVSDMKELMTLHALNISPCAP